MELTPKVLFVIALMMVATYSCNAIIFPEDNTDYLNDYDKFGSIAGTEYSLQGWIDMNFELAYLHIFEDIKIDNRLVYSLRTFQYIEDDYKQSMWGWDKSGYGIFETYGYIYKNPTGGWDTNPSGAGWKWLNGEYAQGQGIPEYFMGKTRAELIKEEYHAYMQDIGAEEKPEGNLIDTISEFLGNLWDGFTQLMRLLTFTNIPNCPSWIVGILNIFFIPMWIVLIIGIAPYVSEMIKTISSFIESFTPW